MKYIDSIIEKLYSKVRSYFILYDVDASCQSMCDRIDEFISRNQESQSRMRETDIEIRKIKTELGIFD